MDDKRVDRCRCCDGTEPEGGWYIAGYCEGEMDFYCSDSCLADDLEGNHDEPDPGEDCGRWINGRLGHQCRKAGSEECDWECPYSR